MSEKSGPGTIPPLDPAGVRFVFMETLAGGNLGSAARALKNLGFARMDLVRPRCDPRGGEARLMAVEARNLLESARCHDDLDAALAGARNVVGSTARKGKYRKPHWRLDAFAPELAAMATSGDLAVVFGREDHGLSDEELDRCTHLVHLPSVESFPSFNLAQAVLLTAYEIRRATVAAAPEALAPPASHESREALYAHLEQALRTIGFIDADTSETILRRFRRLFGRAGIQTEEVKLLRGVARQTLWAAKQAGLEVVDVPEADGESGGGAARVDDAVE